MSFDLAEQVTVLILTRNRQHCLQRVIPFWEKYGIKTLIIDQSDKPLNKATIEHLVIGEYVHLNTSFRQRCIKATEMLNTKYTIVVPDDELYIPSSIKNMVRVLELEKNLSAVGGMTLAIWEYGPLICGNWAYRQTHNYENSMENSLDRIRMHTRDGKRGITSFLTSNLCRTEFLIDCLNLYAKSPLIATEAISTLVICSTGPFRYLNELYWIRNWNEPPHSNLGWNRNLMIHDWWPARDKSNSELSELENELRHTFYKYSQGEDFDLAWNLILSSSKASVSDPHNISFKGPKMNKSLNYFKFIIKSLLNRASLPNSYTEVLKEMEFAKIEIHKSETMEAISIVSSLYPYKNWK